MTIEIVKRRRIVAVDNHLTGQVIDEPSTSTLSRQCRDNVWIGATLMTSAFCNKSLQFLGYRVEIPTKLTIEDNQ